MQNKSFGKKILQGARKRLSGIFHNPYQVVNVGPLRKIYYKHLGSGRIRTHELFGRTLYYYSPTELLHGFKEIFIDEIYRQSLPAKPFIIDCGANIGLSVIYLKRLFPDAEILAFEPDEMNFELLQKNIRSFGFGGVELRKEAVWTENGELYFSSRGSTESRIEESDSVNSKRVNATRLREVIQKKTDFLKIDIEGAEFKVIMDLADKMHLISNLFIEYHGSFQQHRELAELMSLISKYEFSFYIKEAAPVYRTPFFRPFKNTYPFDVQLNIFCFKSQSEENI